MAVTVTELRDEFANWTQSLYAVGGGRARKMAVNSEKEGAMKISFTVIEKIQGKCEHDTKTVDAEIAIEGDAPMVNKVVEAIRKLKLEER